MVEPRVSLAPFWSSRGLGAELQYGNLKKGVVVVGLLLLLFGYFF